MITIHPTTYSTSTQSTKRHKKPGSLRKGHSGYSPRVNPSDNVADEAVHKELGDSLVRAATTASSLESRQGRWFENVSKLSNDSLLARGNRLQSDEDRLKLDKLMALCTTLLSKVLDSEKIKTTQANEIASLKRRVKKLEKKRSLRTHKLKRLYKVSLIAKVESSGDKEDFGEDASKQERRINAIDVDDDITLVNVQDDADNEMFDVDALNDEEVFVAGQNENVVEKVVDAAQVSTTATTVKVTTEEITLAQALEALKTSKPKVKGIVFQEPEPVKPIKNKDQISFDEEVALKLQPKFDKEERLAREKVEKEKEANIALIEEWDDIQAKIDADYQLAERLQAQEQEEFSVEENAKLFQQLLEQRRKESTLLNMKKEAQRLEDKSFDLLQKNGLTKAFTGEIHLLTSEPTWWRSRRGFFNDFAVPLATKSPKIVDWKIHKEGKKSYYQIVRADGKSQIGKSMDYLLWNDLKTMFEPHVEDAIRIYVDLHAGRKEIPSYTTYNYRYAEQKASVNAAEGVNAALLKMLVL
ncbi:hypothetical protein Tco_0961986 [Tanacetum coccineum]